LGFIVVLVGGVVINIVVVGVVRAEGWGEAGFGGLGMVV
jgi:hypothetical protein